MEASLLQEPQKGHSVDRPLRRASCKPFSLLMAALVTDPKYDGSQLRTPGHRLCLSPAFHLFLLCFRSWIYTPFTITEMWNPLSGLSVGNDKVVYTHSELLPS